MLEASRIPELVLAVGSLFQLLVSPVVKWSLRFVASDVLEIYAKRKDSRHDVRAFLALPDRTNVMARYSLFVSDVISTMQAQVMGFLAGLAALLATVLEIGATGEAGSITVNILLPIGALVAVFGSSLVYFVNFGRGRYDPYGWHSAIEVKLVLIVANVALITRPFLAPGH